MVDPLTAINHFVPARCVAFSPQPSNPWLAAVALESGAFWKWDYRKGPMGLLHRYTAAHVESIQGMDWTASGSGSELDGWLCTGGYDKTVKASI